jgi:adenine phosphoribosyltransferase
LYGEEMSKEMSSCDISRHRPEGLEPEEEALCRSLISSTPNWPEAGVTFLSIFPLLADGQALSMMIGVLRDRFSEERITHVAGIDARGFTIGCALAYALGAGFVMVRKSGKLPPPVQSADYELEYGHAEVQVPRALFDGTDTPRVIVVDDMVATGGTMIAGCRLIGDAGGVIVQAVTVMELKRLSGRERIREQVQVELYSLLDY